MKLVTFSLDLAFVCYSNKKSIEICSIFPDLNIFNESKEQGSFSPDLNIFNHEYRNKHKFLMI